MEVRDDKDNEKTPQIKTTQWPVWQVVVFVIVIILAVLYVAIGKDSGSDDKGNVSQVSPTFTPPWPTLEPSKTHTPTLIPSPTPGPTQTHTSVPTVTPTPTNTPTQTPTPTPTNTPVVVITGIHALGRLETIKYVVQTVVDIENEPGNVFDKIFGTDKLLLIASGEVVAGFDLKRVGDDDIVVKDTAITLTLPAPEILYSRLDNDKTYVYKRETGGIFRDFDAELETEARRLGEKQLLNGALENNILSQSEEFGLFYIENLLRSLGFKQIKILVKDDQ
jgi:hypothetical protein